MKMRSVVLVVLMLLLSVPTVFAAMDPVAESGEAVRCWNRDDLFQRIFAGDGKSLSGAGLKGYMDAAGEWLSGQHGDLKVDFLGRGQSRSYNWKTATMNSALLQRKMSNDDYKKLLIVIADYVAAQDRKENGNTSLPAEYYLMDNVNRFCKGGSEAEPMPFIGYLAALMDNKMMKNIGSNSELGKFWMGIVVGDVDSSLSVLRGVPNNRLRMLEPWHAYLRQRAGQ
ncbi:hypothetical protein [Trichlorobacter lovleyi]|uniref:hypothetical protein n=1 Tax=Trichlorobacter lovleyi TaxID=313985 RepID=UPI0024810141|nr:hypothetical protein [Trichlorobacter lovleyi]